MSFVRTTSCATFVQGVGLVGDLLPTSEAAMDREALAAQIAAPRLICGYPMHDITIKALNSQMKLALRSPASESKLFKLVWQRRSQLHLRE